MEPLNRQERMLLHSKTSDHRAARRRKHGGVQGLAVRARPGASADAYYEDNGANGARSFGFLHLSLLNMRHLKSDCPN
jgi:hypothetical protein